MKIFYKKEYLESKKNLENLRKKFHEINVLSFKQQEEIKSLKEKCKIANAFESKYNKQLEVSKAYQQICNQKEAQIKNLEKNNRSLNSARGGLRKKINSLETEKKELEEKLKDAMSDKYVRKILPADRTKSNQKIKATKLANSKVQSYMRKETN